LQIGDVDTDEDLRVDVTETLSRHGIKVKVPSAPSTSTHTNTADRAKGLEKSPPAPANTVRSASPFASDSDALQRRSVSSHNEDGGGEDEEDDEETDEKEAVGKSAAAAAAAAATYASKLPPPATTKSADATTAVPGISSEQKLPAGANNKSPGLSAGSNLGTTKAAAAAAAALPPSNTAAAAKPTIHASGKTVVDAKGKEGSDSKKLSKGKSTPKADKKIKSSAPALKKSAKKQNPNQKK